MAIFIFVNHNLEGVRDEMSDLNINILARIMISQDDVLSKQEGKKEKENGLWKLRWTLKPITELNGIFWSLS